MYNASLQNGYLTVNWDEALLEVQSIVLLILSYPTVYAHRDYLCLLYMLGPFYHHYNYYHHHVSHLHSQSMTHLNLIAPISSSCIIHQVSPVLFDFEVSFGMTMKALRLVGIGLTVLPDEIASQLINLEILSVANNHLTRLPDNLYQLTHLR